MKMSEEETVIPPLECKSSHVRVLRFDLIKFHSFSLASKTWFKL